MEIDLGSAVQFKVKLGDKAWTLREPTLKDVRAFRQASQGEDSDEAFVAFLDSLGLPKADAETLGILKLKKLAESLISSFDEKK